MDSLYQEAAWDCYPGVMIKVTVTKNRNSEFQLNNLSLLWPIGTKLGVWVALIKRQLGIATLRCQWSRSMSLLLKIGIQFLLNNFSCCGLLTPNLMYHGSLYQ
jgi:hypothetical protein